MTTLTLAVIIAALALAQSSDGRFYAALAYAAGHFGHYVLIAPWISDYGYFISAAVTDVLIMAWIMRLARINDTAVSILRVCIAEIVVNAIGWGLWYHYLEPDLYVGLFQLVQVWLIVILMRKDRADELGGYKVDRRCDFLRLVVGSGRSTISTRSS